MKYFKHMKNLFYVLMAAILMQACSHDANHTHQADDKHQSEDHGDHETEVVTLFSENFEVFTEFDLLRVGHESEFLIHVTNLNDDYSAFTDGSVKVVLNINGKRQTEIAEPGEVDGIYKLTLVPEQAGMGSLLFDIQINSMNDKLLEDHVHVYTESDHNIHHHASGASGLICFTKEQAWKSLFNVIQVLPDSFSQVIEVSGEFMAMPGEKQNVIAKSQGIVIFSERNLVQGKYVKSGDVLFTLSGQGLADNNIKVRFNQAKIDFQKSKSNLIRHQNLLKKKIISERQFQETESQYISDSIVYFTLKETVGEEGMKIHAPMSGYLHELNVSEGQFVQPGELLATISTNEVMLLRADVPQQYFNALGKITSTHFRPAYTSRIYILEELSGKLIARGSSVAENNHYMPVYFEVNNDGTLLEGAFAEFYLKTFPEPDQLVIPSTALIEEQNNFYVYVQVSGEAFEKRAIKLKSNDGLYAAVASGLSSGERIVSEGVILIKTATSAAMPAHSHQH